MQIKKVKNDGWQAICLFSKLLSIQQLGQKTSAVTSISDTPRSDFSTYIQIIRSSATQPRETPPTMHHCQPKKWKNSNKNKVMTGKVFITNKLKGIYGKNLLSMTMENPPWSNLQQLPALFSVGVYLARTFLLGCASPHLNLMKRKADSCFQQAKWRGTSPCLHFQSWVHLIKQNDLNREV